MLISDGDCTPEGLEELVGSLLGDPDRLEGMGRAAASAGRRDAADKVAALVESVAKAAA